MPDVVAAPSYDWHRLGQTLTVGTLAALIAGCSAEQAGWPDNSVIANGSPTTAASSAIEAGRYLIAVSGCNDCHTPNYLQNGGNTPESDWLLGTPIGFSGPWGVTYGSNLRLSLSRMSESQFVELARAGGRPPMPWWSLRDMSESDLQAIYRYVRSLPVAGTQMPAALPPGTRPTTPYISMVPIQP